MRIHPDASEPIDPQANIEAYQKLRTKHNNEHVDYYSQLKASDQFSFVESDFKLEEEMKVPGELFFDPMMFFKWGEPEVRDRAKAKIDFREVPEESNNSVKGRSGEVGEKRLGTEDIQEIQSNNEEDQISEIGKDENETVLSFNSPDLAKSFEFNDSFPLPPIPQPLNFTATMTNPNLSLSNKLYILDEILDSSNLMTVNQSSRRDFFGKRKPEMNFVPIKEIKTKKSTSINENSITPDDMLYTITFYPTAKKPQSRAQEFQFVGRANLESLRDAFYCINDFIAYPDLQKQNQVSIKNRREAHLNLPPKVTMIKPKNPLNTSTKKTSPSFLFIEKTFYIDRRSRLELDYSEPIISWANRLQHDKMIKDHPYTDLKREYMDTSTLDSIKWRLDQPYLLCHQGNCEHLFIVKEIRLYDPTIDEPDYNLYPIKKFQARQFRHNCRACGLYDANHVTTSDIHAGQSPSLFCDNCYIPFHFGTNNKPLYSFFHYPYVHS